MSGRVERGVNAQKRGENMNITIQCFGAFRPFGEQISLVVTEGDTVADMRNLLMDKLKQIDASFNKPELLDSSRFATEKEILLESTPLKDGMCIAIIPPVSGG